jgi:hypothetical protein
MTEANWERLIRIAGLRMDHIGVTQVGVQAAGGPSPSWMRKARRLTGPPSRRHRDALDALDVALRWPAGTSWGLVGDDRSEWTDDALESEQAELVEDDDRAGHFGTLVDLALRRRNEADRERLMAEIARLLALPKSADFPMSQD